MKKTLIVCILFASFILTGCATVFGGHISQCQKTQPVVGEPRRQLRVVPFVADIILFPIGLGIDFITGAIYVPCRAEAVKK